MNRYREDTFIDLITNDPDAILSITPEERTEDMWLMAVYKKPSLFKYYATPSEDFCCLAMTFDGSNLKYIVSNPNVRLTRPMAYTAIQNYPAAVFDVPPKMRDDDMREFAFDQDPTLIRYASKVRPEYIAKKLKQDPTFARFLDNPTDEQMCAAIRHDPMVCRYIRYYTPKMIQLLETEYPDLLVLLKNRPEEDFVCVNG